MCSLFSYLTVQKETNVCFVKVNVVVTSVEIFLEVWMPFEEQEDLVEGK